MLALFLGLASTSCDGTGATSVFSATDNSGNTISSIVLSAKNGQFTINVQSTFPWVVSKKPDWINMPFLSDNPNQNTVLIKADDNTGSVRNGVIVIVSITERIEIMVTQNAFTAVFPNALSFPSAGGKLYLEVDAKTKWNITGLKQADWLEITPTAGSTVTTVCVEAKPNTSTSSRSVTLYLDVDGQSPTAIAISQESGSAVVLPWSVFPNNLTFPGSGGLKSFQVTAQSVWYVSVPAGISWIDVRPDSDNKSGTVSVQLLPNTTGVIRSATLTVQSDGQTPIDVQITQETGDVLPPSWSVFPEELTIPGTGGSKSFQVTAESVWLVSSNAAWITIINDSGNQSGTVTIEAIPNSYTTSRQAILTLSAPGATPLTVKVTQEGSPSTISVNPNVLNFPFNGGKQTIEISSNEYWMVNETLDWVSVSMTSGSRDATMTVTVTPNNTGAPRSGTFTFFFSGQGTQATVTVNQETSNFKKATPLSSLGVVEDWSSYYPDSTFVFPVVEGLLVPLPPPERVKAVESYLRKKCGLLPNTWPLDLRDVNNWVNYDRLTIHQYLDKKITNEVLQDLTNWYDPIATLGLR